jgi:DNA polymerase-3 subunit epsilon
LSKTDAFSNFLDAVYSVKLCGCVHNIFKNDGVLMLTNQPCNLVYLDIETTGLNPQNSKIVEIAMFKFADGDEKKFEKLVNPGHPIPLECSKIHSIYDDMVCNCPTFKDIAKDVLDFIGSGTVVCHNAMFDLSFVHKELLESGIAVPPIQYIDTLKLARNHFSFSSNTLGAIANAIGVEVDTAHRAMADVLTMVSVSKYLFANMYRKGIDTIDPILFVAK